MNNKLAVITGASSGIGKSYAYKFASLGYDLLLTARRELLLKNICSDLETKFKINAQYIIAELSNDDQLARIVYQVKNSDNLEVLINNAGYGLPDNFSDTPIEDNINMIKVHDLATMRLTHAAIPIMIKRKQGTIINVSSVASFVISPKNAMYCATKAFLTTFTESLYLELKKYNIKVLALCPGFTHTDFHEKIGYDKNDPVFKTFMSSDDVVDISLKYLNKGKVICLPGLKYKFARLAVGFIPRSLFYKFVSLYSNRKKAK
jgi:short-subunit dehydrogenase